MITVHRLNDFKLGNAAWQIANMIGYATLHGFEFGLAEPWKFQYYFKYPIPVKPGRSSKILQETQFNYYELPSEDNVALSGYWQSPKRFMHCMDLVRHYMTLSDEVVAAANAEHVLAESVVCHVRLKDYCDLVDYHTNLHTTNYYGRALTIATFGEGLHCHALVCSDDIDWCGDNQWINTAKDDKAYLERKYTLRFSYTNQAMHDFYYMTQAEHLVIANSSFSAMAALLNNTGKILAPSKWFGEKGPDNWQDIYHPDWIVI